MGGNPRHCCLSLTFLNLVRLVMSIYCLAYATVGSHAYGTIEQTLRLSKPLQVAYLKLILSQVK